MNNLICVTRTRFAQNLLLSVVSSFV